LTGGIVQTDFHSVANYYSDQALAIRFDNKRLENQRYKLLDAKRVFTFAQENSLRFRGDSLLRAMVADIYDTQMWNILLGGLGTTIADLGCGTAFPFRHLLNGGLHRLVKVTGFDISPAMLDLARDRIAAQIALSGRPATYEMYHGICLYLNALGTEVVSVDPPPRSFSINTESLSYLRDHLHLRNVADCPLESQSFDSITALTGPICYYPLSVQRKLIDDVSAASRETVIIQIKSSDYGLLANETTERNVVGHVARELLRHNHETALSMFHTLDIPGQIRQLIDSTKNKPTALFHHGNRFDIYLTPLEEICEAFKNYGFHVLKIAGVGFLSAVYPRLLLEAYRRCNGTPKLLFEFFRTLDAVENSFCEQLPTLSENCTIVAARQRPMEFQAVEGMDSDLDLREAVSRSFDVVAEDLIEGG
jgi:SAM-dependent methyltransferase